MRFLAVMILLLGACVPAPVPPPILPPGQGAAAACGAKDLQGLVGRPAWVLMFMKFGQTVRIIRPGMAVTMDYSAERLNIEIDPVERIAAVYCG